MEIKDMQKIKKATYLEKYFQLVIHTEFIGPDTFKRSMSITGIPDEKTASDFLKFIGYDIPLEVIKWDGIV